ncbi:MAG: FAD-dependent oxidoreductase [Pseudobutyrivibrio sp.]|nr:FAD-dependent oxidoreductase [Pseudobutyrivibrio sp.]
MKTLIIGGVAGGASCAARLRRLDESAEIVMFERGKYISYANCGLPYYVGDVIHSRDSLLVTTKEQMTSRFNIDVREENEVVAINRDKKSVTVKRVATGETYEESYDKLVISTGSSPIRPRIPGIEDERIQTVWTIPDVDKMRKMVDEKSISSALVVGGGFIGLEMAENLVHAGIKVSLVEAADQVMAPVDYEMAQMLHGEIISKGIDLHLGDGVDHFESEADGVKVVLSSQTSLKADLVILSIGVRPNSELAKEAGLDVNQRGGIIVDTKMKTSDPDIFAVGDVAEVKDFITGGQTMIALAGPANKQGRIVANILAGIDDEYQGSQGSSVVKVFDLTAASTGMNEKTLIKNEIKYEKIYVVQNHHAGYYPGALPMTVKLLFAPDGSRIFGGQIVGYEGVDKRIDTIGEAIRFHATVEDLTDLELAYAPPFSSAKDPINMAGFTAQNLIAGLVSFSNWDVEKESDVTILDVREDVERLAFSIDGAIAMPLGQLRSRIGELDKNKKYAILCGIGVRAYNAGRILRQNGFDNVSVYPGGARFYQATHFKGQANKQQAQSTPATEAAVKTVTLDIDCCGLQCPGPIMNVHKAIESMNDGEILRVVASDPGFAKDIVAWCQHTGNTLLSNGKEGSSFVAQIRKGGLAKEETALVDKNGMSLIVFDGDMDKIMAAFILANGAASMGMPVTMFFTFWGLAALRKAEDVKVDKTAMEKMFGAMLPQGVDKLGISKMNMAGMGSAMMKKIMADKNVSSLSDLMDSAKAAGVKIMACSMSMDVMGIKEEELVDGVEIVGVGTYLGAASDCKINLFI